MACGGPLPSAGPLCVELLRKFGRMTAGEFSEVLLRNHERLELSFSFVGTSLKVKFVLFRTFPPRM